METVAFGACRLHRLYTDKGRIEVDMRHHSESYAFVHLDDIVQGGFEVAGLGSYWFSAARPARLTRGSGIQSCGIERA